MKANEHPPHPGDPLRIKDGLAKHLPKEMGDVREFRSGPASSTSGADIRRYLAAGALFTAVGADTGILARGAGALAAKYKA